MQTDPAITRFLIALAWVPAAFGLYYLLIRSKRLRQEGGEIPAGTGKSLSGIMRQRLPGVVLFGIVPALVILLGFRENLAGYGAILQFHRAPPWWAFLVLVLIPVLVHRAASSESNLAVYPQLRIREWTPLITLASSAGWVLYLVAYEFLFRGFLLTASVAVMAPWLAIVLNCVLYALAHFYKGRLEMIGSLPMGVLFCYLTLVTGNIWWAVLIHSVMALSNEWFSIRAHPGMQFTGARTAFSFRGRPGGNIE